ncbi:MAG: translation initiation factor IF-2 [Methanosarcinales archaeon]|nr:translation initiation factor IF-2 [ANME-2 cluster archaeon]MDF1530701.1 translation initiation factor IF-2 [ANME-2 cluster archaeon]MDW7774773.1 translation initiation factor IF-2 [Methanosarcinales archaeon]
MAHDKNLRTPIVCVMGHVDHGKTSLLDKIRGTAIVEGEAGAITQHIGATEVPLNVINRVCGNQVKDKFKLPGLLFIDTPGHHAFTTLRSRGGALADLAVVIVDVNEGFQPQTIEAINILKHYKTPFVVAANKIDRLHGWDPIPGSPFLASYKKQPEHIRSILDTKLYELVGELYKYGFSADRYDRIRDFQSTIAVIPISAKTGEGLPDILTVLLGLAQKFLETNLEYNTTGPGVGVVLEVKEERGLGMTLDAILHEGEIKVGDMVAVGTLNDPIVTKIRALLKPRPLSEISREEKFTQVKQVTAAAGLKISAPGLDDAIAGAPIRVVTKENAKAISEEIRSEINQTRIETDTVGIIIRADTIGSLEAMVNELKGAEVPIRKADIGNISRRDIVEASAIEDPLYSVVMGFNVDILPDALDELQRTDVKLFISDVIYRLVDDFEEHVENLKTLTEKQRSEAVIRPGKFRILPNHTFRQSKPAVVGVEVEGGVIKKKLNVMNEEGVRIGVIKIIQDKSENVDEARFGSQVAISIEGPVVGRNIKEGELLYIDVPEKHAKIVEQELIDTLSPDELKTLKAFLEIKRRGNVFWGK